MTRPVQFTVDDANRAHDAWGANCGPGAIAAVLNLTLDELRPHLRDFEAKRYTNPSLMYSVLRGLGVLFDVRMSSGRGDIWPFYGLARIQWEGPWMAPGVPVQARYRHTHWIGCHGEDVFDINCISVGGWVPLVEWRDEVAPWLHAYGGWHLTHSIEIDPVVARATRERLAVERTP